MNKMFQMGLVSLIASAVFLNQAALDGQVFEVLAETSVPAPGGDGSVFDSTFSPQVQDGEVVFVGTDGNSTGLFTSINGKLARVVDSNTLIPGTDDNFGSFFGQSPSISNGQVVFVGNTPNRAVWVASNGQLELIVFQQDPVPDLQGTLFASFNNQMIRNGDVVFRGNFGSFGNGIYHSDETGISKVVDSTENILIPGCDGQDFSFFTPTDFDGDSILFVGGVSSQATGVYRTTLSGSISAIADLNTPIPDGEGNFIFFDARFARFGGGGTVFFGRGSNNQNGIYHTGSGELTKVVDFNTLHPELKTPFTNLNAPVVFGDRVFFIGLGVGFNSIFEFSDGELSELIRVGDMIDGRELQQIFSNQLSFDGNQLVFNGNIGLGSTSAIVSVTFPDDPEICQGPIVFSHFDSNDPTTEGWMQTGDGIGNNDGPVLDDLGSGIDAWFIEDTSTVADSFITYEQTPSAAIIGGARTTGWSASINVRIPDAGNSGMPVFFDYSNGETAFTVLFGLQPDLDPTVTLSGQTFTVQEAGNEDYHVFTIVFDPETETADVFVDGIEQLSNLTGQPTDLRRVVWGTGGSSTTGTGHFNEVVFKTTEVLIGDANLDGFLNLLDVAPFVARINDGMFLAEADTNGDGVVDLLDVALFVQALVGT